jgi:subtilase family serine protease
VTQAGVATGPPDLTVSSLTVPATAGAGTTITITDTTQNSGSGDAPSSTTSFYLSGNSWLDASDLLLGSRTVPALGAGTGSTGSTSVTIPSGTAAGTFYIIAKADAPGAISEASESNNVISKTIKIGPDLIVSSLSVPATAIMGTTVTITDTTQNSGGGDASASTTTFYFSSNQTLDAGDILLDSRSVPALGTGASSTGLTSVTIPTGITAGTYYIIAKADASGIITEINEGNNTAYKKITIYP